MPIYIQYDGIKGNVTEGGNGGVWKTTNFLEGGTTNSRGGISVAAGDINSTGTHNALEVSRISLPNSHFGVIDSSDVAVEF